MNRIIKISVMLLATPLSAHAQNGPRREAPRFEVSTMARPVSVSAATPKRATAPTGIVTLGGWITATAGLVGLMAATWNDPDAVSPPVAWAGYGLATAIGAAGATAIWEKPNPELVVGAIIGAFPLLLATQTDNDDMASLMFALSWVTAPIGAALGQRLGRHLKKLRKELPR